MLLIRPPPSLPANIAAHVAGLPDRVQQLQLHTFAQVHWINQFLLEYMFIIIKVLLMYQILNYTIPHKPL